MFNQKGEVNEPNYQMFLLRSLSLSIMSKLNCVNNEQLVVSLTQEGLIRKARAPELSPASKLWKF